MERVRMPPQTFSELAAPARGNQLVGIVVLEGIAQRLEVAFNLTQVALALVQHPVPSEGPELLRQRR